MDVRENYWKSIPTELRSIVSTAQQPIRSRSFYVTLAITFMTNEDSYEIGCYLAQELSPDIAEYLREKDDIVLLWLIHKST